MKCTITNRTAKLLGRAWELIAEQRNPDGTGSMTNTPALPPNEPIEMEFKDTKEGVPCFIKLQHDTLLIKNNSGSEIEVTEGLEIEIIDNPNNLALQLEDFGKIHSHLMEFAEGRVPELTIATVAGRPESATEQVWGQFRNYLYSHAFKKPRWMTFMVPPPFGPTGLTADTLKKELLDIQNNTLVVYFRALERAPGGNTDTFNIKFTFTNNKVYGTSFRNWDGSAQRCVTQPIEHEQVVSHMNAKVLDTVVPALIALIDSGKNVQGGNIQSIEGTIDERAADSDEYDTQWSSIEVLLFKGSSYESGEKKKDGDSPLLLRVHQRSVLVNWRQGWSSPKLEEPRDPASDELQEVVMALDQTTRMGMPNQYSEGETPGGKLIGRVLKWAPMEGKAAEVTPLYLNF